MTPRADIEKRTKIEQFKALLVEHNQPPMSDNQTRMLARQRIEDVQSNYDRTKAKLEEVRATDPNHWHNTPERVAARKEEERKVFEKQEREAAEAKGREPAAKAKNQARLAERMRQRAGREV